MSSREHEGDPLAVGTIDRRSRRNSPWTRPSPSRCPAGCECATPRERQGSCYTGTAPIYEGDLGSVCHRYSQGRVTGESVPLHVGRRMLVWQTSIYGPDGKRVALVTQTQLVLPAAQGINRSARRSLPAHSPAPSGAPRCARRAPRRGVPPPSSRRTSGKAG